MIGSQLLLMLFVFQWLYERLQKEKEELFSDLHFKFNLSEQIAIDSMLMKEILIPVLKHKDISGDSLGEDTLNAIIGEEAGSGKLTGKRMIFSRKNITIRNNDSNVFFGKMEDQLVHAGSMDSSENRVNVIWQSDRPEALRDKVFLRGIKLLGAYLQDSNIKGDTKIRTFIHAPDTSLFRDLFTNQLKPQKFRITWMHSPSSPDSVKKDLLILTSSIFSENLAAKISNIYPYLLKKLMPNLLFGIILLVLTGLAFTVAYGTLMKQYELSRIRNDFVANITHELKTPVSTVKVALEALQSFGFKNDKRHSEEYLDIALQEIDRLDTLTHNVLTSSLQAEKVDWINPEWISLNSLINQVILTLHQRLLEKNAEIEFEPGETDIKLFADIHHLHGILHNLIDNSLKYTKNKPYICIKTELKKGVKIHLSDNGIGVEKKYHKNIFERFFRVPSENTHNVKGYGLGLSYVALVMKLHHGSVAIKDNPGGGSIFTLIFPEIKNG